MTIGELLVKLGLDAKGYTSGLSEAESKSKVATSKLGQHLDSVGKKAGAMSHVMQGIGQGIGQATFGLAEKGLTAIEDKLHEASKAYQDAQVSTAQMDTALRNSVKGYDGNDDAINRVISSGTKLGFSADEQRASLALLVGTTHNVEGAQKAQAAAMDLARLKGIDLATATATIMGAEAGRTAGLKKLGIVVEKGMTNEQILASITKTAGGQAADYAQQDAGKQAAAHARVTEALVKVGKITSQISTAVMPILADAFGNIVDAVSPLLDQLSAQMPAIMATASRLFDTLRGAVDSVAGAIVPLVRQVIPPMLDFIHDITSDGDKMAAVLAIIGGVVAAVVVPPMIAWAVATIAATWPIIAIIAGVTALILILDKLGVLKVIGAYVKQLAAQILPSLQAAFKVITTQVLPPLVKAFNDIVKAVMPPLTQAFNWFATNVLPALGKAFDWIVKNVLPPLKQAIGTLIDIYIKVISKEIDVLTKTVLPALGAAFNWIVKNVLPPVQAAIGFITGTVIPALSSAFKTAGDVIGKVWSGISSAVKTAINIVIGAIDAIISGINAIQLHIDLRPPIGPELKFDYNGPHLSKIPYLHSGGIVPGAPGSDVLAMLQAGERVVPRSQVNNTSNGGHTFIINNPVKETASQSVFRANLRMAAMGYRG